LKKTEIFFNIKHSFSALISKDLSGLRHRPSCKHVSGDSGSRRSLRRRACRGSAHPQQAQERDANFDNDFISNRFDPLTNPLFRNKEFKNYLISNVY
jgi:hypothetical protein